MKFDITKPLLQGIGKLDDDSRAAPKRGEVTPPRVFWRQGFIGPARERYPADVLDGVFGWWHRFDPVPRDYRRLPASRPAYEVYPDGPEGRKVGADERTPSQFRGHHT